MQIGPPGDLSSNPVYYLLYYVPFIVFILYGQKLQSWMILSDLSRSLGRLREMRDVARKETIDYVKNTLKPASDPAEKVDQLLEYFAIMPVDIDPTGIVRKIEHIFTVREERMRKEVVKLGTSQDSVQISAAENILEVSTALNSLYKITRHFYLMGRRTKSFFLLVQVQMIMPMILEIASALHEALNAIKNLQPLGDGVGPMVVGKLMLGRETMKISRDTVMASLEQDGRFLYVLKAEGPSGYVGDIGSAISKMVEQMGVQVKVIIMVDAGLKLEGEKTGEVAEGVGAAIGGIGVDRFKIEEVASKHSIPVYAVIVKESISEAISVMKREIAEAAEEAMARVMRVIKEKTKPGDSIVLVGVGNSLGVAQ